METTQKPQKNTNSQNLSTTQRTQIREGMDTANKLTVSLQSQRAVAKDTLLKPYTL